MNLKEREAAWAVDQLDPDNWLTIPDFGINPQDVAFDGFALPILGPTDEHYWLRQIMREHVRTARLLIRDEGFTMSEIHLNELEVIDMVEASRPDEVISTSHHQDTGSFYLTVMTYAAHTDLLPSSRTSLLYSARLGGHEPHAYFMDALGRLPAQPASRIAELLPHHWTPLPTA